MHLAIPKTSKYYHILISFMKVYIYFNIPVEIWKHLTSHILPVASL